MKIKKIFLTCILAGTLYVFNACSDAYNVDPADEIADANAILNMDDLNRAVTAVYGSIPGDLFIAWSAYFTDECRKPSSNRGQGVQVHTWSINSSTNEPASYYGGLYGLINRANTVLGKMDGVILTQQADIDKRELYRAELKAIRAMAHFDLLRFFSTSYDNPSANGISIVTQVDLLSTPSRNTVGEVFTFVKNELTDAYNIVSTYGDNSDVTRITPLGIQALRARVALYSKDYDNALVYAQDVIDNVPLASSPTQYLDIWSDAGNSEVVFELKRVQGDGQVGRIFKDSNGDVFFNISNDLWSKFTSTDLRRQVGALFETGSTTDNIKVGKYSGPTSNYGLADIKLFRVAELYLIKAEASVLKSTPDLLSGENALNTLRASRRLSPSALPNLSFSSASDAITKILDERRRELAFEGHRFFDLKRFNLGVDRLASDVLLNSFAEDLAAGDYRFTLPIPQNAIFANDNLIQNPGY